MWVHGFDTIKRRKVRFIGLEVNQKMKNHNKKKTSFLNLSSPILKEKV